MINGRTISYSFILIYVCICLFAGLFTSTAFAITTPQNPATESTIVIAADGIAPFDATTSTPAGTDANDTNGVVRNFDSVTYLVEVTLNDADDTNVNATVTLNDKGSWLSIPADCRTNANGFPVTPDSSISDTTGDNLNDTLFCNLGDHTEGTKLSFRPVAQAVGNNTDILQASVLSNSDNNVNTGDSDSGNDPIDDGFETTQGSGPIPTEITAGFGINVDKSVLSLPEEDESDYLPQYNPVNTLIPGSEEGTTVKWHIALNYNTGSEFIADTGMGSGVQNFTITDTWFGTHSNDSSVEGNNAMGDFDDQIKMLGSVTLVPTDNCSLVGAVSGTVSCTQPGGPGTPITIQISGVAVNQRQLAKVELNMFFPFDDLFDPNGFAQSETYNINNTATLTGWGGTDGLGAALPLLSASVPAAADTPGPASEDFLVSASRTGPSSFTKTFTGIGFNKNGQRAAVKGEIVTTSLGITDRRLYDTHLGVCDTLDTDSFEFVGSIGAGQADALFDNTPTFSTYALDDNTTNGRVTTHDQFNPKVIVFNNAQDPNDFDIAFISDGSNEGLVLQYSSVPYSVTGDDHWTATCQDELDGDPTTIDWTTDYTTIGAANVVRIRLVWQRDFSDLASKLADITSLPVLGTQAAYSFDLRIKDTMTVTEGTYLPNTAATFRTRLTPWTTTGVDNWLGTTVGGTPLRQDYDVQDDDTNALFSFNTTNADRVFVLSASMAIDKVNDPISQPPVAPGDTVSFTIDPRTAGSNASAVTMTFTDTLPSQLSYLSDDCAAVYAAVGLTCDVTVNSPTSITFDVPGYQLGDDLPPFTIQATVNSGVPAGTYTNTVAISSDFADLTDDSYCENAVAIRDIPADGIMAGDITPEAIANCESTFRAPHTDTASILVVSQSGLRIRKNDAAITTQPLANFTDTLTYENLGGTEIGVGHLIDILPYNGDGFDSTLRFNSENPANANTSTDSTDSDARAEFVSITPSSAGETFEYTITPSAMLDHRPCHPSNWPNGNSAMGATNPTLNTICSLGLIDPATDLPTLTQTGSGTTTWTVAPPANLSDVTGIRATLPVFPSTEAQRDIILTLNAGSVLEGDLYCNNCGLNSDVVTLDTISNDVCIEVVTGSIGDYVYFDLNNDGVQDGTDIPLVGITLTLEDGMGNPILIDPVTGAIVPAGTPGAVPYTVMTDANGNYSFDNLPAGDYVVIVDQSTLPPGMTQTEDPDGVFDSMSSHTLSSEVDGDVEDNVGQDFGYHIPPAEIGNYTWIDANGDGIQDPGEDPLPGVTVELTYFGPDGVPGGGDDVTFTMTTDANGEYLFTNLIPGDYKLTFTPPAGFNYTTADQGGDDALDSDADASMGGMTISTTLDPSESDLTWDAGFVPDETPTPGPGGGVSVGDTVFFDVDRDGEQDPGEFAIPGVTVNLYDSNGNLVGTTITDANGNYLFDVAPGVDYEIRLDNPLDYQPGGPLFNAVLTIDNAGSDDARDSDGILVNGFPVIAFTSPAEGVDNTLDFGFVGSSAVNHALLVDSLMSSGAGLISSLARAVGANCDVSTRKMKRIAARSMTLYTEVWAVVWTMMKSDSDRECLINAEILELYDNRPHKRFIRSNVKKLRNLGQVLKKSSCQSTDSTSTRARKRLRKISKRIRRQLRRSPDTVYTCVPNQGIVSGDGSTAAPSQ